MDTEQAQNLKEELATALQAWLEAEMPKQIEFIVASVLEEMIEPTFARFLRARLEQDLRPRLRRELEIQIRRELASDIENIRKKVLQEELEFARYLASKTAKAQRNESSDSNTPTAAPPSAQNTDETNEDVKI